MKTSISFIYSFFLGRVTVIHLLVAKILQKLWIKEQKLKILVNQNPHFCVSFCVYAQSLSFVQFFQSMRSFFVTP